MQDIKDIIKSDPKYQKIMEGFETTGAYFKAKGYDHYVEWGWLKIENVKKAVEQGFIKVGLYPEGKKITVIKPVIGEVGVYNILTDTPSKVHKATSSIINPQKYEKVLMKDGSYKVLPVADNADEAFKNMK